MKVLNSETQIRKDYNEMLKGKSERSRNTHLTKWIREVRETLAHLQETFNRPLKDRYYLGEFISWTDIENARRELKVLADLRGVEQVPAGEEWTEISLLPTTDASKVARVKKSLTPGEIHVVLKFRVKDSEYYTYRNQAREIAKKMFKL